MTGCSYCGSDVKFNTTRHLAKECKDAPARFILIAKADIANRGVKFFEMPKPNPPRGNSGRATPSDEKTARPKPTSRPASTTRRPPKKGRRASPAKKKLKTKRATNWID